MENHHDRVVTLYRQLIEAWNRRDADGFASVFAEDGSSVGFDGSQMNGRKEIASEINQIFADHETATYVARTRETRQLGAGVALLRAVVGMIPPGTEELNPAANAIQSVVVVEEPSGLRIALLHNTPAAFHGRPHLAEQLTEELAEAARTGQTVMDAH